MAAVEQLIEQLIFLIIDAGNKFYFNTCIKYLRVVFDFCVPFKYRSILFNYLFFETKNYYRIFNYYLFIIIFLTLN